MEKYSAIVGIDVSKSKLDIRIIIDTSAKNYPHFIVPNCEKGIREMMRTLRKEKIVIPDVLFCFENTGIYSMPLAIHCSKNELNYWEIPAIEIKKSKGLVRGKSDKTDALDIAFYAITHLHKLKLCKIAEESIMKLQLLYSEREKVLKAILALQSSGEVTEFLPKNMIKEVLAINKRAITNLKLSLKQIDKSIALLVKSDEQIGNCFKLATSVPGVGTQSAVYLIIKTRCFTRFKNWRKLACYAGVAPFEYSSGSSIKGKTRLSHMADKKMKSLLNMAAMSAKRTDKEMSTYYDRKVKEGKNKMLVMNAIRCKILSRVFAVIDRKTPFVNTQKFAA